VQATLPNFTTIIYITTIITIMTHLEKAPIAISMEIARIMKKKMMRAPYKILLYETRSQIITGARTMGLTLASLLPYQMTSLTKVVQCRIEGVAHTEVGEFLPLPLPRLLFSR
jgi:hypothetical protein